MHFIIDFLPYYNYFYLSIATGDNLIFIY